MTPSVDEKVRVRLFVEERNEGMVCVPYKTLIGYTMRNRPIIGRLSEQISGSEEIASKAAAVEKAGGESESRIMELFGHVEEADTEWEVIHESASELVEVTYEASKAMGRGEWLPQLHSKIKSCPS